MTYEEEQRRERQQQVLRALEEKWGLRRASDIPAPRIRASDLGITNKGDANSLRLKVDEAIANYEEQMRGFRFKPTC